MTKYRNIHEAFADPELFCTSVAALMVDNFGMEWLDWEPETVEIELRNLGVVPDSLLKDKIMAVSTILGTNLFHTSFVAWNNLVQVLNFDVAHSDLFVPASMDDVLWGSTEARIMEGSETFDQEPFSDDICYYAGTLLSQSGLTKSPSILSFAKFDEAEVTQRDDALTSEEFLFTAYWQNHQQMSQELETFAIDRTRKLFAQIGRLPLKDADLDFIQRLSNPE